MLADHRAAAQGCETDIARAVRSGMAVPHPDRAVLERDLPSGGGGLAEEQGGLEGASTFMR